jgi:hypothetical protein
MARRMEFKNYAKSRVFSFLLFFLLLFLVFKIPSMILTSSKAELGDGAKEFYKFFYDIHESVKVKDSKISTSRHYIKFLNAFKNIYEKKRSTIAGRQGHLKVNN